MEQKCSTVRVSDWENGIERDGACKWMSHRSFVTLVQWNWLHRHDKKDIGWVLEGKRRKSIFTLSETHWTHFCTTLGEGSSKFFVLLSVHFSHSCAILTFFSFSSSSVNLWLKLFLTQLNKWRVACRVYLTCTTMENKMTFSTL